MAEWSGFLGGTPKALTVNMGVRPAHQARPLSASLTSQANGAGNGRAFFIRISYNRCVISCFMIIYSGGKAET